MNAHNEQQARQLLAFGLDEYGHHTEAYNVRNGIDLDVYKAELWAIRAALDAQPSPVVKQNLTTQPAAAQEAVACPRTAPFALKDPNADFSFGKPERFRPASVVDAEGRELFTVSQHGEPELARFVVAAMNAYAAPVAAAPGIDLSKLQRYEPDKENKTYGWMFGMKEDVTGCWVHIEDLRTMIDASPKGDEPRTPIDGCTESNCPRCRTHPDHRGDMEHAGIGRRPPQDSPKGGSEAIADTDRLNFIAAGFLHIEPVEIRASEDDADAGWVISEHHMRQGLVELIRWDNDNLRAAIDAAMHAQASDAEVPPLCDLCRKRPEAHSDAEGIGFCEVCWGEWVEANSHGAGADRG